MRQETGQGMNFLEAIFSFVFGDGNPNESYEDRRWRLVSGLPCQQQDVHLSACMSGFWFC